MGNEDNIPLTLKPVISNPNVLKNCEYLYGEDGLPQVSCWATLSMIAVSLYTQQVRSSTWGQQQVNKNNWPASLARLRFFFPRISYAISVSHVSTETYGAAKTDIQYQKFQNYRIWKFSLLLAIYTDSLTGNELVFLSRKRLIGQSLLYLNDTSYLLGLSGTHFSRSALKTLNSETKQVEPSLKSAIGSKTPAIPCK